MLMARKTDDPLIPPEQSRRHEYETVEIDHPLGWKSRGRTIRIRAKKIATQTPLDRYLKRRQITPLQHKAGSTLFNDWYKSGLSPRLVADPSRMNVGETTYGMAATERQAHHRKRYRQAIQAVGIMWSKELVACCCEGEPVGKGGPMVILRRALDVLTEHYGF